MMRRTSENVHVPASAPMGPREPSYGGGPNHEFADSRLSLLHEFVERASRAAVLS